MKARVKATGEIVEVIAVGDYINEFGQIIGEYKDANGMPYNSYDLDFYIEEGITIPDYWTRLKHQYAGMVMQGLIIDANNRLCEKLNNNEDVQNANEIVKEHKRIAASICVSYATALIEKLREEK